MPACRKPCHDVSRRGFSHCMTSSGAAKAANTPAAAVSTRVRAAISAVPEPIERGDAAEPVSRADLLALFAAARIVADRHFDDARAAREHAAGNFVIQLEAARPQIEPDD